MLYYTKTTTITIFKSITIRRDGKQEYFNWNMYILNEPKICKRAGWRTRKGRWEGKQDGKESSREAKMWSLYLKITSSTVTLLIISSALQKKKTNKTEDTTSYYTQTEPTSSQLSCFHIQNSHWSINTCNDKVQASQIVFMHMYLLTWTIGTGPWSWSVSAIIRRWWSSPLKEIRKKPNNIHYERSLIHITSTEHNHFLSTEILGLHEWFQLYLAVA